MKLEFVLDRHPPSTNNLFLTIGKRRVKSREYRVFETCMQALLFTRGDRAEVKKWAGAPIGVTINLFDPSWKFKNGNHKRSDLDNFLKSGIDAICAFYGLDDSLVMAISAEKKIGDTVSTQFIFEFYDPGAHDVGLLI